MGGFGHEEVKIQTKRGRCLLWNGSDFFYECDTDSVVRHDDAAGCEWIVEVVVDILVYVGDGVSEGSA